MAFCSNIGFGFSKSIHTNINPNPFLLLFFFFKDQLDTGFRKTALVYRWQIQYRLKMFSSWDCKENKAGHVVTEIKSLCLLSLGFFLSEG